MKALGGKKEKLHTYINTFFFLFKNVIIQTQRDRIYSIIMQTGVTEASVCSSVETGNISACSNPISSSC